MKPSRAVWLWALPLSGCAGMQLYDGPIREELTRFLREDAGEPGCRAAFDADGTLWSDDIGEAFFQWLIAEKKLLHPYDRPDLFAEYERLNGIDKKIGYPYPVQAMAGLAEEQVRAWARDFAAKWRPHIYDAQRALIRELRAAGCEVWIVSASNRWLIEAAAPHVGVEPRNVIGMSVLVREGRLTAEVEPPITYREGKVTALSQRFAEPPWLVSGDAMTDFEMLEYAARVRLAIGPDDREPNELLRRAAERGWLVQRFPNPAR
jgi:HAD superfamily phosphoserine phosphatase-like hydrolase